MSDNPYSPTIRATLEFLEHGWNVQFPPVFSDNLGSPSARSASGSSQDDPFRYDNSHDGVASGEASHDQPENLGANYIEASPANSDSRSDKNQAEVPDVTEYFGVFSSEANHVNVDHNEAAKYSRGARTIKQNEAERFGTSYIKPGHIKPYNSKNLAGVYQVSSSSDIQEVDKSYIMARSIRPANDEVYMNRSEIPTIRQNEAENNMGLGINMNQSSSIDPWYRAANNGFLPKETHSNQPPPSNPLGIYTSGNVPNYRQVNHPVPNQTWSSNPSRVYDNGNEAEDRGVNNHHGVNSYRGINDHRGVNSPVANVTTYNYFESSEVNNSRTKSFRGSYHEADRVNSDNVQAGKDRDLLQVVDQNNARNKGYGSMTAAVNAEEPNSSKCRHIETWLNNANGSRVTSSLVASNRISSSSDSTLSRPNSELASVGPMTSEVLSARIPLLDLMKGTSALQAALLAQHLRNNHVLVLPDAHGLHLAVNYASAGLAPQLADPYRPFTTTLLPPALHKHLRTYTFFVPTHHGWVSDAALASHQRVAFLSSRFGGGGPGAAPSMQQQRDWFASRVQLEAGERRAHRGVVVMRIRELARGMKEALSGGEAYAVEWTRGEIVFQEWCDGWGERCGAERLLVEGVRGKVGEVGEWLGRGVMGRFAEGETVVGEW